MNYPKPHDYGFRLRGFDATKGFLERIRKEMGSGSRWMSGMGEEAIRIIKRRTVKGIGVDGKPFKDLSDQYAEKKETRKRTLSSTGNSDQGMLGAISQLEFRKGPAFKIIIYIKKKLNRWGYGRKNNKYIIAEVHNYGMISGRKRKGRFKMPRSWFFGLSRKEREHLRSMMLKMFVYIYRL